MAYPQRGQIYTFAQILKLKLDDEPFLRFMHEGKRAVIQTSHVLDEDLLRIEGFADTQWRYERTTHEWIPLFTYVGYRSILDFVTIEPTAPIFKDGSDDPYWVCPKGFYREQVV